MKAENTKGIKKWLHDVELGTIQLPPFQRGVVWKPEMVAKFIETILQRPESPLGVFLLLKVGDTQQFPEAKPLKGASGEPEAVSLYLLDGQQRLTALLKAFKEPGSGEEERCYYTKIPSNFQSGNDLPNDIDMSSEVFMDDPAEEYNAGLLPLCILHPDNNGSAITKWLTKTNLRSGREKERVRNFCEELKKRISETKIPHFELPADTDAARAIRIFINLNTQSVRLSPYYEAVARMDKTCHGTPYTPLPKVRESLETNVPNIKNLEKNTATATGELILKVGYLMQGMKPTDGSPPEDFDFKKFAKDTKKIKDGIKWATDFLSDEFNIKDKKRLPTNVPLRVLPALHQDMPKSGTKKAKCDKYVKKYLWRAFLTDHYQSQANVKLKEDFEDLQALIKGKKQESEVRIFKVPPPTIKAIREAGWPSGNRLGKGILLACCLDGAKDITEATKLSKKTNEVELHHIFPRTHLKTIKTKISEEYMKSALNCMLLTKHTNARTWNKKLPGDFIAKMEEEVKKNFSKDEIKNRFKTHLLDDDLLLQLRKVKESAYQSIGTKRAEDDGVENLAKAYCGFIEARAKLVKNRIKDLLKDGEL